MRVLAHIHTFNDAEVIDRTIEAVRGQTRPVDGILVVDNASSDDTLKRPSLEHAIVLRHVTNLGTSGAVCSGISYALEHDFDWIWLFDADSIPAPDALEKLLALYADQAPGEREKIAFIACLPRDARRGDPQHGHVFTRCGFATVSPPDAREYCCHATIWSGCLYRLAAIRHVGLPNPDYVLDCGEGEYGYRLMKAGYVGNIVQNSILYHNVRGHEGIRQVRVKLGPFKVTLFEFPPIRCYYICRNVIYFAIYDFGEERLSYLRSIAWWAYGFPPRFLLKPWSHRKHLIACLRGLWHGVTGNIAARY